jgi:hypothetical protein
MGQPFFSSHSGSVGKKSSKLEQIGNLLPLYRQMISTGRTEIITNKTEVSIKYN